MLKIAVAPSYQYRLPISHRFPMIKYELIPTQLIYEGVVEKHNFFEPTLVPEEVLLSVHTREYWDILNHFPVPRKLERNIGFPVRVDLIERGRCIAQGTIDCALYAMDYGLALNTAGGTHHSFADRGEGFCVFNDIAIAAKYLLDRGLVKRIIIIDLDVHQGNGTANIFNNESRVYTFSMHGARNYPHRKERSDLDIGLYDGCGDGDYLKILSGQLVTLLDQFKPDIAFYQAGVDILDTDRLGRLNVSRRGCMYRDEIVFGECAKRCIPVAVTMGGGYSERIADIVDAHVNTFKVAKDVFVM